MARLRIYLLPTLALAFAFVQLGPSQSHSRRVQKRDLPWIRTLAFDPKGERLLAGDSIGWFTLWELATDQVIGQFALPPFCDADDAAFTPDGKQFLVSSGSKQGCTGLWYTPVNVRMIRGDDHGSTTISISPDGKNAVTSNSHFGRPLDLWDLQNPERLKRSRFKYPIRWAKYYPDGKHLLVVTEDRLAKFDLKSDKAVKWFNIKRFQQGLPQVSADFTKVACIQVDQSLPYNRSRIEVYDLEKDSVIGSLGPKGKNKHERESIFSLFNGFLFSPDAKTILILADWTPENEKQTLSAWDVQTGNLRKIVQVKSQHKGVEAMAISPDGKILALGGRTGMVSLFQLPDLRETRQIPVPQAEKKPYQ
jgi:WD40 repeat protein